MAKLKIVGMDPSLRNWGMAKGVYDTETGMFDIPESHLACTESVKDKRAQNVRDIADAEQLFREVYPYCKGADFICIECPVGSQSAAAMKAYAICIALVACIKCAGHRVIITTPMQGKAVISGTNDAKANSSLNITKKEVIQWVAQKHPELPLPRYKRNGEMLISQDSAEHLADSVIAMYAGLNQTNFSLT